MAGIDALMKNLSVSGSDWDKLTATVPQLVASALKGGKEDVDEAVTALGSLKALTEKAMLHAEPFLCAELGNILQACQSKQSAVRKAAEEVVMEIISNMNSFSTREVLTHLFAAAKVENGWEQRVVALKAIAALGDSSSENLGNSLPEVVPEITDHIVDTKKQVAEAARLAMTAACDVIGNRDIEHMTTHIVRSFTHPAEVPEIMHKLAGVTFVQSVQSPALAMVVPLLTKGLKVNKTATRRQSSVIIDNMSKLVDDPLDAAPFLPALLPALSRAAEAISDPEAGGKCGIPEKGEPQRCAAGVAGRKTYCFEHDVTDKKSEYQCVGEDRLFVVSKGEDAQMLAVPRALLLLGPPPRRRGAARRLGSFL